MSLLKYPHSKELDPYFLPVLREARMFMTLAAYRVLYQELQEALKISDVSIVHIAAEVNEDILQFFPVFNPFNEDHVATPYRFV